MLQAFARVLAALAVAVCAQVIAAEAPVNPIEPVVAGDRVEVVANSGQHYAMQVSGVRDGVLLGRCLMSGSEFRLDLSALRSVHKIELNSSQDVRAMLTVIGAGLNVMQRGNSPAN